MKQNKIQIVGSFIMIGVLMMMMIYTGICAMFQLLKKFNISNDFIDKIYEFENKIEIDYAQMYPFENEVQEVVEGKSILEKYEGIVNKIKDKLEKCTSKRLVGYEKFIEYSYQYNDLIAYKLVSNSNDARIELEDGYFSFLIKKRNVTECSERLIEFKEYLDTLNIDLCYVQAPFKLSKTQEMSAIYRDYSNENMDSLLNAIKGKIDYIDLRENINKSNQNHLKLFYKTDHHWLPETGLWATKEISDYLNSHYNLELKTDNIHPEKYHSQKYAKMFLGSDGRYVSLKNAEPEEFTLLTPKFDTKLKVKILDKGINKEGNFEDTLMDWSKVKYENYYNISQYEAYLYGNIALAEIKNELVQNHKKVLLIRDSFCEVVAPFLALENEELSVLDLRYFDGSLKTYINQFKPDIVVVMYNGSVLMDLDKNTLTDDLAKNLWNFE